MMSLERSRSGLMAMAISLREGGLREGVLDYLMPHHDPL